MAKKVKKAAPQSRETARIKSFLDMIAPSVVKFEPDHFICGNTFRCVWALREYPTQTDEQAILRHLGEKDGITLRIYTRQVTPAEEKRIIQNAANKNRMGSSNTNDLQQTITAESNLQDVASLVACMHRNREPLLHCAVYGSQFCPTVHGGQCHGGEVRYADPLLLPSKKPEAVGGNGLSTGLPRDCPRAAGLS